MKNRTPFVLAIVLVFSTGTSANALTIVNITGSGDLSVSVTGAVHFDATTLSLTDLTLSAAESIVFDSAYPAGVPGTPTATINLFDVMDATELSIIGDAFFDQFDFTGSLTLQAETIYAIGSISADSITANAGSSGGGDDPCGGGTEGGGVVLGSGSFDIPGYGCVPTNITPPDGGIIIGPGPGPIVSQAIPEPSASLLFAMGVIALALGNRRR